MTIQHHEGAAEVPVTLAPHDDVGPVTHDPVTGLPDASALRARIEQTLDGRGGAASALLAVDCGGLAEQVRSLGPETAARLRRELARRLEQHAGPPDFAAQAGGDRFVLWLARLEDPACAERVAGALVHDLTRPVRLEARDVRTHAAIGVAVAPNHGRDAMSLLTRADAALREAQDLGGDTYLLAR
ncbi:MAG: diguanylate cyclase domain-containing protein [Myxococcota bacterium]